MLPIVQEAVHAQGFFKKSLGSYFEWVHPTHVIACHVRSGGNYILGREHFTLRSPYLGLLAAGERDANGLVGPYEMFWCSFEWAGIRPRGGEQIELVLGSTSVLRRPIRPLKPSELQRAVGLFRDLQSLSRSPDLPSRLLASSKLVALLALWAEPPVTTEGENRAVRLYRNLIEEYAVEPKVTLEDLAQRVGMSLDHLGMRFHKEMGVPPIEYRTRLRLLRARELLTTTAKSISEIGSEVGFPNLNYFGRLFRKRYGISPSEYSRTSGSTPDSQ